VIIPAAGSGKRMGGARKPFLQLGGKSLLQHCLDVFLSVPGVQHIVVVVPESELQLYRTLIVNQRITFVAGGAQRADSVRAGLNALPAEAEVILVHDAARPLLTRRMVEAVAETAGQGTSATIAVPVTDTVHRVNPNGMIVDTPDRAQFWRAQTPQAFPRRALEQAYARVGNASAATDEAGLVAQAGFPVRVIPGDASNLKITTPDDVALAEAALQKRTP
jgi:2-C-methyl-D-erythritol 4-phosphate cytidylyltransferase